MNIGDNWAVAALAFFVIFGIGSTVIYYFARYYFRTHDGDNEVVPSLRDTAEADKAQEVVRPQKTEHAEKELAESVVTEVPLEEFSQKVVEPESAPKAEKPKTKDLKEALSATKKGIFGRIQSAFVSSQSMGEDEIEMLEEILYTSDLGPHSVQRLVEAVGEKMEGGDKGSLEKVRSALRDEMFKIFTDLGDKNKNENALGLLVNEAKPTVIMVVGVNGAGKTTSIGKLAHQFASNNLKVMVAAGDTFRAAAKEQLNVWSERANVEIFSPENVSDPSAVAFDACTSAKSKGFDVVIVDTAGRLHTQDNLMEELKKMKRVIQKVIPDGPHETIIVLDANSGQNALMQAKTFHGDLDLTGAILTKLDGSAKGGVAIGLACELQLPIRLIGVGEGIEDLRPFDSKEFVESII